MLTDKHYSHVLSAAAAASVESDYHYIVLQDLTSSYRSLEDCEEYLKDNIFLQSGNSSPVLTFAKFEKFTISEESYRELFFSNEVGSNESQEALQEASLHRNYDVLLVSIVKDDNYWRSVSALQYRITRKEIVGAMMNKLTILTNLLLSSGAAADKADIIHRVAESDKTFFKTKSRDYKSQLEISPDLYSEKFKIYISQIIRAMKEITK